VRPLYVLLAERAGMRVIPASHPEDELPVVPEELEPPKPVAGPLVAVIVSLKTGQSLKGVLLDRRADAIILRATSVAAVDANTNVEWHSLDGDVVIPMENIDFWQEGLDAAILDSLEERKPRRRS
jgi:hypothetical protein